MIIFVIIGAIIGLIYKDKALIVKPFGDIFVNLLLVIIVPLIFFTITASISKMNQPKRLNKMIINIVITFLITSLVAVLFGFGTATLTSLINKEDTQNIISQFDTTIKNDNELNILERTRQLRFPRSGERLCLEAAPHRADRIERQCSAALPRSFYPVYRWS